MKIRRVLAVALSIMMIAGVICVPAVSVSAAGAPARYEEYANELDEKAYTGDDLGATYTKESTTFKLWAPRAKAVQVKLYKTGSDKEKGAGLISTTDMINTEGNTDGLWSVKIDGDLKNIYYTYVVSNPLKNEATEKPTEVPTGEPTEVPTGEPTEVTTEAPTEKPTEEPTQVHEVVDVYAKAAGVEGNRGMIVDLASTNPKGWENDTYKLVPNQTDANIWELHIKDFSYDKNSGMSEANRGKYLAFTEKGTTLNNDGKNATGVDYLKQLGINYVHINPFYDFASVTEAGSNDQFNWGYDPKNYNVPEGSYSSNPYDGNVRIKEVKEMIMALHEAGIGVIMDVVYNHTFANTDSWFQKTVPNYYYRFNSSGGWSSGSGCGNDTASEHEMFRKYMVESVTYWAKEYHIDGFRFDLMGLHDVVTMNAIRASLDEIDTRLLMYGEGWSLMQNQDSDCPAGASQANAGKMSERIAHFNDQIRDGLKGSVFEAKGKGYLQGVTGSAAAVKIGIGANTKGGAWKAKGPSQTVTYSSAHDNYTLYDKLVLSLKGGTKEQFAQRYEDLVAMNKLNAAIIYSSQGIPFIHAGEEFARTKFGDENSYQSSPEINKLDWSRTVEYKDLVSYYSGMMEIRANYDLFRDPTNDTALNKMQFSTGTPAGTIAYTINDDTQAWKTVAVAFNNTSAPLDVKLTAKTGTTLPEKWTVIANEQTAGVLSLGEVTGNVVTVPANGAMILVDKTSFEAAAVPTDKGLLTVNHIDKNSGKVIKSTSLQGAIGTDYETAKDTSFAIDYDYNSSSDNITGVYAKEPTVVNYYYTKYSLQAKDISGDKKVSLEDVIMIQKDIAKVSNLDEEKAAIADVNCDGNVTVADALIYQKNIAKVQVNGVGTLQINYIDSQSGKAIDRAPAEISRNRTGTQYKTEAIDISYYELDETKLPKNADGRYTDGLVEVNYYYTYKPVERTVHVKLMEGQTWIPSLHAWDENGDLFAPIAWPGKPMTKGDDGWFSISFTCGGTYSFIVNDGVKDSGYQTLDNVDYDSDIWVVLNVAKPRKGANDVTVHTSKPV